MDWAPPADLGPLEGTARVPASKSVEQRVRVLGALCEPPPGLPARFGPPPGADVEHLARALARLGTWRGGALGAGRERLALDAGEGATGFRFLLALAALRPAGARTLVTGSPGLRARPHRPVGRALLRLGAQLHRRPSGAWRVHGGGLRQRGPLVVDATRTSHAASALALVGWRLAGGLSARLLGPVVSRPYLDLTLAALARFGLAGRLEPAGSADLWLVTPEQTRGSAAVPADLPADASAAAGLLVAAALRGGRVRVEGLLGPEPQADLLALDLLERAGVGVARGADGAVEVAATPGQPLAPLGRVDLTAAPDLIFLAGVLAAAARGTTHLLATARTRTKESDREAGLARALGALGARVAALPGAGGLAVTGGALRGTRLSTAGDHRAAFAFGALALRVPGLVVGGAACVAKSHPEFWAELERLGGAQGRATKGAAPPRGTMPPPGRSPAP